MKMPFGKYKGEDLEDVPTGYLLWLLENGENLSSALIEEIENQIGILLRLEGK
jgi:uncharacterized protein (DUF3820 family)